MSNWVIAGAAIGALAISAYNAFGIHKVHVLVNSRLTELLNLTKKTAKAEGLQEGRDEKP